MTGTEAEPQPQGPTFIAALDVDVWAEGDLPRARAVLRPEMWAPGTRRPRLGLLATMVDIAGGTLPSGALNPTVDLRVQLLADPPSEGRVELFTTPLKHGRRLFVGEVTVHAGDSATPFARGTITFLNQVIQGFTGFVAHPDRELPFSSFDELLGLRFPDARTVVVDPAPGLRNGPGGTVQGGAQATIAEILAERAVAERGRFAVVDLDIRFLGSLRGPRLFGRAEVLPSPPGEPLVRVALFDGDADGFPVSHVIASLRALP